jgi:very-short-patch-repair endonuclease
VTRVSMPELLLEEQLKGAGIPYEREYRFHPTRKWRADFGVPLGIDILIEVEGGTWIKGRHTTGSGFAKDAEKYNAAAELGYRVLRYTPSMIEDGSALAQIKRVLGL